MACPRICKQSFNSEGASFGKLIVGLGQFTKNILNL